MKIVELTGDVQEYSDVSLKKADIILTTPEKVWRRERDLSKIVKDT